MDIRTPTAELSVSPQLMAADLRALREAGLLSLDDMLKGREWLARPERVA